MAKRKGKKLGAPKMPKIGVLKQIRLEMGSKRSRGGGGRQSRDRRGRFT